MSSTTLPGTELNPGLDWPSEYPRFRPRRWMVNGHLQTILGNFLPRRDSLPAPVQQLVEVSPAHGSQIASQVLCECHWQPISQRATSPTAILLHGLEGSSHSQYVIGNANKLWLAGCNVVRMNMRNCGPGKDSDKLRRTPTLYHSGLSQDVDRVMQFFIEAEDLQSIALIGYSMGGNLVLKLAGDLGESAPPQLRSVVGVSPAVDLAASADALHEPQNRIYERKFVRAMVKRFRQKAGIFPRAYDPQRAAHITSLREFDERITALYCGFRSADDYYYRVAAARVLPAIRIPALIVHALDDPFVRLTAETRAAIITNPHITFLETEHGGHCAFLASPDREKNNEGYNDGYWAEHTALRFVLAHA
ncbi:MAG: alpha/beta fold hydrolase [Acidobacteriaceae bacterium]